MYIYTEFAREMDLDAVEAFDKFQFAGFQLSLVLVPHLMRVQGFKVWRVWGFRVSESRV